MFRMKKGFNPLWALLVFIAASLFSGCGGGSSSGDATAPASVDLSAKPSYGGTVVDPYIAGAVFLEVSSNGKTLQYSTPSDDKGGFSFSHPLTSGSVLQMKADARGKHLMRPFEGKLKRVVDQKGPLVVSPLTTLLANGLSAGEALSLLAESGLHGLTEKDLLKDPLVELVQGDWPLSDEDLTLLQANVGVNAFFARSGNYDMTAGEILAQKDRLRESVELVQTVTLKVNTMNALGEELWRDADSVGLPLRPEPILWAGVSIAEAAVAAERGGEDLLLSAGEKMVHARELALLYFVQENRGESELEAAIAKGLLPDIEADAVVVVPDGSQEEVSWEPEDAGAGDIDVVEPVYEAPVLDLVTIVDDNYYLTWSLPIAATETPAGGYDVIVDGVDDNLHHTTPSAVKSGLQPGVEHCFQVEARWTQAVPAVSAISNQVCVLGNDDIAPTVSITSPSSDATYTSAQTVTVMVFAQDNVGVTKVELYDGSALKGTDTTAPYSFSWPISSADNGKHNFTVKSYDVAGNSMISSVVTVTVEIVEISNNVFYGYSPSVGATDDPYAAPYGGIPRYVDPTRGVNSGSGSINSPWKDLQYAMTRAAAGDTIYLRGGVHNYGVTINGNVASTQQKPIEIRSFPGEWAIIDGTNIANGNLVRLLNESWIIFRNFEIRNSDKTKSASGIYAENLTDCEFHNLFIHDNNGAGFSAKQLYRCKFYNCTSSNNANIQTNGNTGDGFSVTSGGNNEYYRCVSIGNSDDGYDSWAATENYFEDCIASGNGTGTEGNGNGFKLGKPNQEPVIESRGGFHTLVRCIALNNRSRGFTENATINGSTFTGCIAYKSGKNWSLTNAAHKVTNCFSFDGTGDSIGSSTTIVDSKGQGFGGTVYVSDFESVDIVDMNNQSPRSRFFYAIRNLY